MFVLNELHNACTNCISVQIAHGIKVHVEVLLAFELVDLLVHIHPPHGILALDLLIQLAVEDVEGYLCHRFHVFETEHE